jgi:PAS domain S-box-containing protein
VKHALRRTGRAAPAVCAFFRLDYDGGLHESEHLAAIVRSSDEAILSKDRNAIVTSWNEAAQRLYGYTADEIVGKPVATIIPPERQGEELEIVAKIFAGERVEQYDTERVRKDGTRIAVSLTASPIHDSNGEVVGVSTQARDVSSTRLALQQAELQLRGAPVGIAIFSVEPGSLGRLQHANDQMTRLFGYSHQELSGLAPGEITHPDDAERERALFEDLAAGRRSSFGIEKRNRHKDGHWVWVALTVSLLEDEDPPRTALAHVLDISERKRAEQELDQFAYVASHDLKEPLILLSAYARMLAERHGDALDEEGRTFLRHVREEAGRMKSMIDDLLAYSRLQTAAEDTSPVGLGDVLDTALRTLAPQLEETAAQVDVQGPLPVVEGSPAQFERLFRNLIGNAIKFRGEPPPAVIVSATREEAGWIVSVRDNGIGVDPAKANRIFDVFQRLHSQEQYAGTGMGLAICKRIVERHGGRIWVDPAPGGGSTFKFSLPE